MKYDFETILNRKGHDALAVDAPYSNIGGFAPLGPKDGFSLIPMWIADMNFPVLPTITNAIIKRTEHPAFGYFSTCDDYYNSIINWQKKRHGLDISRDEIGYENGVLGCLASALRACTKPGDTVLLHSPKYVGFAHVLDSCDRKAVYSPLLHDKDGTWRMDYADMDRKITEHNIKFAIFCSPHNPTGRVWEKAELEAAMKIYEKHNVTVFSDEIWSDIILSGNKFIPTLCAGDYAKNNTIAVYAPSKTFNLAGLIGSYHIIYNPELRKRVTDEGDSTHYNSINVLSQHALVGAYRKDGEEWVDELCEVLEDNVCYACEFIKSHFEGAELTKPQGTYMLYVDMSGYLKKSGRTLDEVLKTSWDVGVAWQDGRPFGMDNTIRVNLALPKTLVIEAFDRLDKYVFNKR